MNFNREATDRILQELAPFGARLVAVSKTKPAEAIRELYDYGQRHFGENYVQELTEKQDVLPKDIEWHYIGHLQTNKVRYISPFVSLIHTVDSLKLLREINKEAFKAGRIQDCLLQLYVAQEETKFGLYPAEASAMLDHPDLSTFKNIRLTGVMGMASNTEDSNKVREEFKMLRKFFDDRKNSHPACIHFKDISMGMTSDYRIALEEGSTIVRIGSAIFGERITTS